MVDEVIRYRRELHEIAEVGFNTVKTVGYVVEKLTEMGYEPRRVGKGGVALDIGRGEGKCLLIRADIDALPIRELTDESFKCESGNMHACGHDMHTAMLLGCAKRLLKIKDEIKGTVRLAFQSAEESLEGAKDLIENGILESPKVDFAVAMHVATGVNIDTGTLILANEGVSAPCADMFEIRIKGKGGHGAMTADINDPVSVICHVISAVEAMVAKELASSEGGMVSIGQISAGSAPNVIADTAIARGSLRAMSEEKRELVKKRLCQIVKCFSEGMKTSGDVSFLSGTPTLLTDGALLSEIEKILKNGGFRLITSAAGKSSFGGRGSDDFAQISQRVPSVYLSLCAGSRDEGYVYPLHNQRAVFDERALKVGVDAFFEIALSLTKD